MNRFSDRTLAVAVGSDRSGVIETANNSDYTFIYDEKLADDSAVSITMPVSHRAYQSGELHPIFSQNLPEGYLGDIIRKYVSKTYDSTQLTLLAALGPCQIGRLSYSSDTIPENEQPGTVESLQQLLTSDDDLLFDELVDKYALRSGISGVQPKVVLEASHGDKATLKTDGYIVKSWSSDFPQLAANEFFCMKVAALSGLQTPEFALSGNDRLFIMKRFDKLDDGRYLGFEDGCVLQGLEPGEKYSGSYEKLVKSITTFVSAEHQQRARQQLFTSLTVSWAVQNGDAHLKNFGILYDRPSGARYLAPAFDIVSTTPYLSRDTPALTLAGKKAWGNLRSLEEFGRVRCGLSMSAVATIFTRVGQTLEQVAVDMESYIHDKPAFKDVGAKMQATFSSSQRLFNTHLAKPG